MKSKHKLAIVALLIAAITTLHYVIDPSIGAIHELLGRAYYIPVVLAGLWFGWKGGIICAVVISIPYWPHAFHGWHSPYSPFFRLLEIVMYHVIGGVVGILSEKTGRALTTARDSLHEKEKALDEKAFAYEELQKKTKELFELEEHLRRSDRLAALGKLSAGLAHEIRNPLGSIKTCAEYLCEKNAEKEKKDDQDQPDFSAVLLEETERLNLIVNRFLEFARDETQQQVDEPLYCRVDEVLHKIEQLFSHQLEKQNIELQIALKLDQPTAKICNSHLRQVFLNLFLNSIEAIGENGWIRVEVEKDSRGGIVIAFSDSGPGIPQEISMRVFDPFFTTKDKGTGLGLSIVERIVSSHDGKIELARGKDSNSQFNIHFDFYE